MSEKAYFEGTGRRLKKLRLKLGLNQEEMAARFGVKKTTYYKNEKGYTCPQVETLMTMSEKDNISMDWFLLGRGAQVLDEDQTELSEMQEELEKLRGEKDEWRKIHADFEEKEKQRRTEKTERELKHQNELKDLEIKLREQIAAEMKEKFEREVPGQMEPKLREELSKELKAVLEKELTPKLKAELRPVLEEKIRAALEKEVTEELNRAHAQSLLDGTAAIAVRQEIKDLLAHMEKVPLLYHEILVQFHRFRMDYRELVEGAMISNHPSAGGGV